MYVLGILSTLLVATSAKFCSDYMDVVCGTLEGKDAPSLTNCKANYGEFEEFQTDLQAHANLHIEKSFEFLLMSAHFGNYETNREGFKGLYRKLSDKAWEDAIDVIKFITKRGGEMSFNQHTPFDKTPKVLAINELSSLAAGLDKSKRLANEALRIHSKAQHHSTKDSSVAHYIEERFFESQAECIRNLAGYVSDLKSLLKDNAASISVFLFDEYLKKTL